MPQIPLPASISPQHGAALVVSMMMLVAITLIGVAVMGNSRLEWLMASNSNLQGNALIQAQTNLSTAETTLVQQVCTVPPNPADPLTNCSARNRAWTADPYYHATANPPAANPRIVANWNAGNLGSGGVFIVVYRGCAYLNGATDANCGAVGVPTPPFMDTYEVWAIAVNANMSTARIVRSTFVTATNPLGGGATATGGRINVFINTPLDPGQSATQRVGYAEISN